MCHRQYCTVCVTYSTLSHAILLPIQYSFEYLGVVVAASDDDEVLGPSGDEELLSDGEPQVPRAQVHPLVRARGTGLHVAVKSLLGGNGRTRARLTCRFQGIPEKECALGCSRPHLRVAGFGD